MNQLKTQRKQQYGSIQVSTEGQEKQSPSLKLPSEGISENRPRIINSELGYYVPSTEMISNLTAGEEVPLSAMKGKMLNQQPSQKELEKKTIKMTINRMKNSSMIHIDGNKL